MIVLEEYRGTLLENIHHITAVVTDDRGKVVASSGDADKLCYYRSTAKPIQVLPALVRQLPQKYGFTQDEIAILNASHWGTTHHIATLEAMLTKTGLTESDFILKPFMPLWHTQRALLTASSPSEATNVPRVLTHDCTGKHINLMLLQRELTGSPKDYWRIESPAQQEVLQMIARFSGVDKAEIVIGTDGCGVPVFGTTLTRIATAYAKLIQPQEQVGLEEAITCNLDAIHAHPEKINDYATPNYYLNQNDNYIAKDGARGIWCLGLKKEHLGIAFKMEDGMDTQWYALILAKILEEIGCADRDMIDCLRQSVKTEIVNDNGVAVGSVCVNGSIMKD
ncbi:MAG: asparaginase [Lachnospiraceae bacterium]